jgi:hypothetical protein
VPRVTPDADTTVHSYRANALGCHQSHSSQVALHGINKDDREVGIDDGRSLSAMSSTTQTPGPGV